MEPLEKLFQLLDLPAKNWEKIIERAQALQAQVVKGESYINQQESVLLSYLEVDKVNERINGWLNLIFPVFIESDFYQQYAAVELNTASLKQLWSTFREEQQELDVFIEAVANWLLDQLASIPTQDSQFKQLIPIVKTMLLVLLYIPDDLDFEDEEKVQQLTKEKADALLPPLFDLIKVVTGKDLFDGSTENNETLLAIFELLQSGSFISSSTPDDDGSAGPTTDSPDPATDTTPDAPQDPTDATEYSLKVADLLQHLKGQYPNLFTLLEQPPISRLLTILKEQDTQIILIGLDGPAFLNQLTALFELPPGFDLSDKTALVNLVQERLKQTMELMLHIKSLEQLVTRAKENITAIVDTIAALFSDLGLGSPIALMEQAQKKLVEILKQLLPVNTLVDQFESASQWVIDIAQLIYDSPIKLSITVTDAPLIDAIVADNERLSESSHAVVVKEPSSTARIAPPVSGGSNSGTGTATNQPDSSTANTETTNTETNSSQTTSNNRQEGDSLGGALSQLFSELLFANLGERIQDKANKETFNQLSNNTYFDERFDAFGQWIESVVEQWQAFKRNIFTATERTTLQRIVTSFQQWINDGFSEFLALLIKNLNALIKLFFALIQMCVNAFVNAKPPGFVVSGQLYRSLCLDKQISVFCLLAAMPITLVAEILASLS